MATRYPGTEKEIRALNAFITLMRAADSVSSRIYQRSPAGSDGSLTVSQFGVLEALFHLGPMCQCDLGAKLLKSGGNITLVVDNLEKRGLVRRERDAEDRRFVRVHLTGEGRRLIGGIFPRHVAAIVGEMDSLTAAELEGLRRLCRKLGKGKAA